VFHSILAAVDGSSPSTGALALAERIARHHGAALTALTVPPTAPAILREAEAAGHDLIVLGSRGRGAVAATVLGSVARSVVSRSRVPVLVVKDAGGCATAQRFSRILIALEHLPESVAALRVAADLAQTEMARLTLMTVASVRRIVGMPESALVRLHFDHAEHAHDLLDAALAALPKGLAVDSRVAWGQVDAAILEEVEQGGYDLLVLGSRGRGLGRATLLGSTGLSMLRRCPVPVLIARSAAPGDQTGDQPWQSAGAPAARAAAAR
jgi:nucleotide-binding universal stress UspA family protein